MQFKRYSNVGMQSTNFLDSVGKGIFMSAFSKAEEFVIQIKHLAGNVQVHIQKLYYLS